MSHVIELPDDLYEKVARLAAARGQPVDELAADLLAREIAQAAVSAAPAPGELDWTTASAEEIIAAIHAARVERERPIGL